jgi:hypothetical protein
MAATRSERCKCVAVIDNSKSTTTEGEIMKNTATQTKPTLSETTNAMRLVRATNTRVDLVNQLRQAEKALKRKDTAVVTAYMEGLVTAVLILRRSLSAAVAARILLGITIDCFNHGIVLPMVSYSKNSRCVFNTGACTPQKGSWCTRISSTWGCGTVPNGPWLVNKL